LTQSSRVDVARATGWGSFVASLILVGIYVGSRRLRHFDAALVPYTEAGIISAVGPGYRCSWLTRPPTRLLAAPLAPVLRAITRRAKSLTPRRAGRREHRRAALQAIAMNRLAGIDYPISALTDGPR
jgi:hypothetical protein